MLAITFAVFLIAVEWRAHPKDRPADPEPAAPLGTARPKPLRRPGIFRAPSELRVEGRMGEPRNPEWVMIIPLDLQSKCEQLGCQIWTAGNMGGPAGAPA